MSNQQTQSAQREARSAPPHSSADARRLANLITEAEAAVTALRSIENMLQSEVDRVIQGYRGKWCKVSLVASDTATHSADDLEAALMDWKLKGCDGK